jgi:hypothetical protein
MTCIRLNREDVATFAKHFLFGLPSKFMQERGGDLMIFRHYDKEAGPTDVVIIENEDIFWCRKYLLDVARKFKERNGLGEFAKYWEKHLKMLEKAAMPCKKKKKRKKKRKK